MSNYRYTITLIDPVKNEDGFYHVYLDNRLIKFKRHAPFEFTTLKKLSDEELKTKLEKTEHKYKIQVNVNNLRENE